jgi:hypothetical protein
LRAIDRDLDALANPGSLRGGDGGETFVLGLLAGLAAFRLVLQAFIVKENLLASRPDEILSTVNTMNIAIIELHLGVTPLSIGPVCSGVCLRHFKNP